MALRGNLEPDAFQREIEDIVERALPGEATSVVRVSRERSYFPSEVHFQVQLHGESNTPENWDKLRQSEELDALEGRLGVPQDRTVVYDASLMTPESEAERAASTLSEKNLERGARAEAVDRGELSEEASQELAERAFESGLDPEARAAAERDVAEAKRLEAQLETAVERSHAPNLTRDPEQGY